MSTLLIIELLFLFSVNVVLEIKYKRAVPVIQNPWNGCAVLAIDDEGEEVFYWDYELNVYVGGTVIFLYVLVGEELSLHTEMQFSCQSIFAALM
jgi:hypothetical protein